MRFGPFELREGELAREGKPLAVGQRALALLEALAAAEGAVDKAALMDAGWPGITVEESNLTVQMAALRKALGPRPDGSEWIVTVPRIGYRLARGGGVPAAAPGQPPLLVVLPLQNIGGDAEQAQFGDGLVEDLLAALSRFRSFAVSKAAAGLGARYQLDGSIRRVARQVRVSVQLVEAGTGVHLWARTFEGVLDDVFDLQDRTTSAVAAAVEPLVVTAEIERIRQAPVNEADAYDLYMRAVAELQTTRPGAERRGAEYAERCLAIDPDNARAHALVANAHAGPYDQQSAESAAADRAKGLRHAHAGLALAGNDAEVRAVCGLAVIFTGEDYETGLAALRQAVSDNPNSVAVLGYAGTGELRGGSLDAAERLLMRAIGFGARDAIDEWLPLGMAHVRLVQRRFAEALDWAMRSHAVAPHNQMTLWFIIAAHAHLGRLDEAKRWLARLATLTPQATLATIRPGQATRDPARFELVIDGLRMAGLRES